MFENIIGNNEIKKSLNAIVEPSHAYIFTGPEGVGKFLYAKEFAYKWLCTSDQKPCGVCKSCIQFKTNNNMDFEIIEPDNGSIKVEQIRILIKKVYEKPIESLKKVYIINDADKMTVSAQNALLKILEEPPAYVMIILVGSNEHLFLNTIKSRCIVFKFINVQDSEMEEYLIRNGKEASKEYLELYQGSIGKVQKLDGFEDKYLELKNIIYNLEHLTKVEIIKNISKLITKENAENVLEYMNTLFFKLGVKDIKYLSLINNINETLNKLRTNSNFEMVIDNLTFCICKVVKK